MSLDAPQKTPLERAIELLGGYTATAHALGMKTAWGVQKWRRVPAGRVPALVRATKNQVTAHDLRPDLYPAGVVIPEEEAEEAA